MGFFKLTVNDPEFTDLSYQILIGGKNKVYYVSDDEFAISCLDGKLKKRVKFFKFDDLDAKNSNMVDFVLVIRDEIENHYELKNGDTFKRVYFKKFLSEQRFDDELFFMSGSCRKSFSDDCGLFYLIGRSKYLTISDNLIEYVCQKEDSVYFRKNDAKSNATEQLDDRGIVPYKINTFYYYKNGFLFRHPVRSEIGSVRFDIGNVSLN